MSDDDKKRDPALDRTLTEPLDPLLDPDTSSSTLASIRAPTMKDPVIGTTVSGYVVKSRLGTGGMGIVYEGHHEVIGKRAAIKVLRPEYAENPEQMQRLVSEARAVNEVGHRGIIDVFGYGQLPDGRQCIVMEFLDGQPLEDLMKNTKKAGKMMPLDEVLEILDEVLSALNAAHSANVVHRDLKPSNIFLVQQRDAKFVKLLDFGIAKLGALGGSTPVSRASMIAGTPTYMAPEQARGAGAHPTMDLYSVGIMAFEMLTNVPPFDSDSVMGMLMMHAEQIPKKPSQLRSEVPDALDELVLRLLAKKPGDRFKSAEHVRAEVVRLKAHLKDPVAPRTLQDQEVLPSVQSQILPMSSSLNGDTMAQALPPAAADDEVNKATMMKPFASPAAAGAAPVRETLIVPKKVPRDEAPSGTSQLLPPQKRWPAFLVAMVIGSLFVAAAFVAFSPAEQLPPTPVAVKPKPAPAPPAPPQPVEPPPAAVKVVEPEPAPLPPPIVEAPPPAPPPEPVKVAAVKAPRAPAEPRVAPPPPPPSKKAIASSGLVGRLKKLETRIDKAQAGGAELGLYLKQVQRIRQKLEAGPLAPEDQSRVEVALDNLEKSDEY